VIQLITIRGSDVSKEDDVMDEIRLKRANIRTLVLQLASNRTKKIYLFLARKNVLKKKLKENVHQKWSRFFVFF
jgi:hypothetical protein